MARSAPSRSARVAWLLTWPFTLVFAAMVFLTAEHIREPLEDPSLAPRPGLSAERLPERIEAVTRALQRTSLPLSEPREDLQGAAATRHVHRRYDMVIPPEEEDRVHLAVETLHGVDPGVSIVWQHRGDGFDAQVAVDGLLTHTLHFLWKQAVAPRVAVILDDFGDDLRLAREVVGFDAPVALAVRPSRPFSREVTALAQLFTREVLLQFDSADQAEQEPTENGADGGESDVAATLDAALATVPNAVGVTGAVTKAVAKDGKALERLLAEIRARNLFCVGNLGAADFIGAAAAKAGLPIELHPLPIDPEGDPVKLVTQLEAVITKAKGDGTAVVIAHPTAETMEALSRAVTDWRAAGVDTVRVSDIVQASQ